MHCYFVSFVTPLRLKKDRLLAFTYPPTYPHKLTNLNYQSKAIAIAIAIATQYRSRTIPKHTNKQTQQANTASKQYNEVRYLLYSIVSFRKPSQN
jgi:hypothetical protein